MGVVTLIRHGQASFGADDYDVLSPTGRLQCRALGEWLTGHRRRPDEVVYGGLRRHRESVAALGEDLDLAGRLTQDRRWDEFDHLAVVAAHPASGAGLDAPPLDRRAFQRLFERATARWTSGVFDDEYDESFGQFVDRVAAALRDVCDRAAAGRDLLVVTSGGVIAVAATLLLAPAGLPPEVRAGLWGRLNTVLLNSSATVVVVGPSGPRLLTYNEHAHLAADLRTYR